MSLKDSLLNLSHTYDYPFNHWQIDKPLTESMVKELMNVNISDAPRSFDGTRAADGGGDGKDGKLRVFLEFDNAHLLPEGHQLIEDLRDKDVIAKIEENIKKKVSEYFIRVEYITDRKGFWLKPHKDIEEKLMTMMLFINTYNESESLGTDFYDESMKLVKTIPYKHNTGYYFASGGKTWHGLEKKEIKIERRCMQINYVTFPTSWPVKK
ncbi:MAG: hypothetical protein O3C61_05925 [Proteobacteria bacterium]|nr:hypothetical protein [Pseudomonadota bacterium]